MSVDQSVHRPMGFSPLYQLRSTERLTDLDLVDCPPVIEFKKLYLLFLPYTQVFWISPSHPHSKIAPVLDAPNGEGTPSRRWKARDVPTPAQQRRCGCGPWESGFGMAQGPSEAGEDPLILCRPMPLTLSGFHSHKVFSEGSIPQG